MGGKNTLTERLGAVLLLFVCAVRIQGQMKSSLRKAPHNILYMEDHCRIHLYNYLLDNDSVKVSKSAVVELSGNTGEPHEMECVATFSAERPSEKLLLHFETLDINYNTGTLDRLRIYDGKDTKHQLTGERGLYGKFMKGEYEISSGDIRDYVSSKQSITLYFVGIASNAFKGFRIILTAFRDPLGNGTCPQNYFECKVKKMCIPDSLKCDGNQNCGLKDDTDEGDACSPTEAPSSNNFNIDNTADLGLMVGSAISIVILMIVVMWLGIVCIKRTRFKRMWRHRPMQPPLDEYMAPELIGSMVAPINFLEPPPEYSETAEQPATHRGGQRPVGCFELPPPYSVDDCEAARQATTQAENQNQSNEAQQLAESLTRTLTSSDPHQGFSVAQHILIEHGRTEPVTRDNLENSESDSLVLAEEASEETQQLTETIEDTEAISSEECAGNTDINSSENTQTAELNTAQEEEEAGLLVTTSPNQESCNDAIESKA